MTPLSIAYIATAAICVVVALQHLVMALRVKDRKPQILFAIASLAVAGDAVFERRTFVASSAAEFLGAMPWTALFIVVTIVAMTWYIGIRTGALRRGALLALAILGLATVVVDFSVGIAYTGPVEFGSTSLPWGETIAHLSGETNPLRIIGDLVLFGFLLILIDGTITMVRRGEPRQARLLGLSLVVYALALLTIIPADLGWFHFPSAHTFAFLVIVAAMSWDLSEDLIRTSELSREVVAGERRWRQLLGDVQLLAVRVDCDGRVVDINPFFTEVMGFTQDEAVGHEYWDFVAPEQRDQRKAAFHRAMEGDPTREVEVATTSKEGRRRQIIWRNVVLKAADGAIEGMLSI
jgi:PAS domain S-box-containing protein